MSGRWWGLTIALLLALAARPAAATLLVPMSDEDLVASSDLIVVGSVARIETVLLAGTRVVSRVTLAVERALKGEAAADTVVVTQAGGEVGGRRVVIFGAPEYTVGERVLAFLRRQRDGSLETNALALGKYGIRERAGATTARRTEPVLDERPLDAFTARIAALAAPAAGVRSDGRAGAGVALPDLVAVTTAFTFGSDDNGMPSRWFEADCGLPVAFSRANADPIAGDAASAAALAEAAAAWTAVADASLALAVGPAATPTRSLVSGTADGSNTVQFDDPFDEVPDLAGCTGVLGVGGYVWAVGTGLTKMVGSLTFSRIFEGDVTFNDGVVACFPEAGLLAEVAAHELGHAIGLAHSSENPSEPDPVLADALMYFRAHNDGRGASVRADDEAGLVTAYPSTLLATTPLAQLACETNLGLLSLPCFGQSTLAVPLARFGKARTAVERAAGATAVRKQRKQLKKALGFIAKTDKAIVANVPGACGEAMRAAVARLRERVTAVRDAL